MRQFYFLLAGHLSMTVEELLDRISAPELEEWYAFYRLRPFGDEWKQTAFVCTMVGNTAGGKKSGGKFTPDDFMPIKPRSQPMTSDQMFSVLKMLSERPRT